MEVSTDTHALNEKIHDDEKEAGLIAKGDFYQFLVLPIFIYPLYHDRAKTIRL